MAKYVKRIGQRRVVKRSTKLVRANYRSTPGVIKPKAAYKLRSTAAVYGRLGENGKKRFKSDLKKTLVKTLEQDPGLLADILDEIREESLGLNSEVSDPDLTFDSQPGIDVLAVRIFDRYDDVFQKLA